MTTATTTRTATAQGPAVLRAKQVKELLAAPDRRRRRGRRDAALLAVLAGGGLRVGEAVRLTIDQVEQAAGGRVRLLVRTGKQREGSPPRYRTVSLPAPAARLLREYIEHVEPRYWLFSGRRNEHLCTRQAQKIVTAYLRAIGAGHLHTHSLRHSFASIAVRETRNIFAVSKILGHKDVRTTAQTYAHFDPSDADSAADAVAQALARRTRDL